MKNRLIFLIIKQKKLIFAGMLLGLLMFFAYLKFCYTPYYLTSSKLFIRNIENQDVVAQYGEQSTIKSESGYSNPLFNLIQIIQSEELASKIYNRLEKAAPDDLAKMGIKSKDDWYASYLGLIKVKIEPSTDIVKINLKWTSKENSVKALNLLVDEFKKINLEIRKSVESQQTKFVNEQVKDIENKLNEVRNKIRIYSLKTNTVDIDSEKEELTRARVELLKEAEVLKSDISYYDRKFADLSAQLGLPDAKTALRATSIGQDPYLIRLNQDLSNAQQNFAKLNAKFTGKHPEVIAAQKEISSIKKNIEKRERESLGKILVKRGIYDKPSQDIVTEMAQVQAEKTSSAARYSALKNCVSDLMKKEAELPNKIYGLEDLKKQEDALVTAYGNARQKQMEANIKEHFIVDNIYQLGQPTEPKYLRQSVFIKFFGFICFGFLLVLGFVWLQEEIEDKWDSSSEIEQITGLSVLGAIPWDTENNVFEIALNRWPGIIMDTAYKNIANKLILKSYNTNSQSIAFISTSDSRSKPIITTNVAIALAKLDRKVLLLDTNFIEPEKLINEFNLDINEVAKKDIIQVLDEINTKQRISRSISDEELDKILHDSLAYIEFSTEKGEQKAFSYLCAHKKVENIYDYVATNGINILINYLKNIYEFIIIETPEKPFILPEFAAISEVSDSIVIISAMNSSKEVLMEMIHKFDRTGKKILGIITREIEEKKPRYFNLKVTEDDEFLNQPET